MRAVYKWVAALALLAIVVQVGFAGYGAFYAAHKIDKSGTDPKSITESQFEHGFNAHGAGALAVLIAVLLLLIVGIVAGVGRWRLGRHGVLALLFVLQVFLAFVGFGVPAVGFFHPVNALVIFAVAGWIVRDEWRGAHAAEQAAAPT